MVTTKLILVEVDILNTKINDEIMMIYWLIYWLILEKLINNNKVNSTTQLSASLLYRLHSFCGTDINIINFVTSLK